MNEAVPTYTPEIARLQMLLGKAHDRIAQLEIELIKRTIELNETHEELIKWQQETHTKAAEQSLPPQP